MCGSQGMSHALWLTKSQSNYHHQSFNNPKLPTLTPGPPWHSKSKETSENESASSPHSSTSNATLANSRLPNITSPHPILNLTSKWPKWPRILVHRRYPPTSHPHSVNCSKNIENMALRIFDFRLGKKTHGQRNQRIAYTYLYSNRS